MPTIALAGVGADDGVDPPAPLEMVAPHLKRHITLPGIGHNLPREAPAALADAVLEVERRQ